MHITIIFDFVNEIWWHHEWTNITMIIIAEASILSFCVSTKCYCCVLCNIVIANDFKMPNDTKTMLLLILNIRFSVSFSILTKSDEFHISNHKYFRIYWELREEWNWWFLTISKAKALIPLHNVYLVYFFTWLFLAWEAHQQTAFMDCDNKHNERQT